VDAQGVQLAGDGVDMPRNHVRGEDVGGVGIWVAEEVCERNGGEGVIVGEGGFIELNHYGCGRFM